MAQPPLALPQSSVGAELFFGPSSRCHDPYKGSFAFPLLITANPPTGRVRYAAWLRDVRGTVELELFRVVDTDNVAKATESGLSRGRLADLTVRLLGFVVGGGQATAMGGVAQPFFRTVRCDPLVYGFENGQWFERGFDTIEAWEADVARLRKRLGPAQAKADRARLDALLDACGEAPPRGRARAG
jgi:hypothetical protein